MEQKMKQRKDALLVIDMQRDFVDADGPFADRDKEGLPENLVDDVLRTIKKARDAGMYIVHVYQEHRPGMVDFGRELDRSKPHCVEGTKGAEIIEEIEVRDDDLHVIKRRFSGFMATDLDILLRGLGVERIFVCGIAGDGCVRATAFDGHQLGYRIKVVEEAVAGLTRESCHWALKYLASLQKDVIVSVEDDWTK